MKIAQSISEYLEHEIVMKVDRNQLWDDAPPREASRFTPVYWERGRKMLLWIVLWMLALPMGMFGFFSVLLWAYGVDG